MCMNTQDSPYHIQSKLYILKDNLHYITPDRITLLESISSSGSISAAAKCMKKSYKWAWDSIDEINTHATQPLVVRISGGKGGGGTNLSPFGLELLHYYKTLEALHQRQLLMYEKNILNALANNNFENFIGSTLKGIIKTVNYKDNYCYLSIECAKTILSTSFSQNSFNALSLHVDKEICFIVEASQIILSTTQVSISARNSLIGVAKEIKHSATNTVSVLLELNSDEELYVDITEQSFEELNISINTKYYAYFKASNITILPQKDSCEEK